ncbi:MAG: spore coat protein [Pseudomonadota bacterium]|jgi:hypothetical protein
MLTFSFAWIAACGGGQAVLVGEGAEPTAPVDTAASDVPDVQASAGVVVNEVLSVNRSTRLPGFVGDADAIELYNPSEASLDLAGWSVRDEGSEFWRLPPGFVVPARGVAVLIADGRPELGPDHLPFALSEAGDAVVLRRPDGSEDGLRFGPLIPDVALARSVDGGALWVVTDAPTLGEIQGGAGVDPVGVQAPDARCGLALDVAPTWSVEGADLLPRVTCADGEDPGGTSWVSRADFVQDAVWETDLSDAGTWPILAVRPPEGTSGVPQTAVAVVSVADAWQRPRNVPVDPSTYEEEWGLPVLHLLPAGRVTESYVRAEAWWKGQRLNAQMKVRGAASAGYPKPSYTVEFDPVSLPIEGAPDKDHLVLISDFDDNAHVRQKLVYDAWERLAQGAPSPRLVPSAWHVVVYLDGVYQGLFTAVDHIDDEFVREQGFTEGGPLFKSVTHDANYYRTDAGGGEKGWLAAGWEKKEGLPEDDVSAIADLTAWSADASDASFAAEAGGRLAVDTFIDWFLLVRHVAAGDSGGKNAYLYQDPLDGRFHYAPWDFNEALGQNWQTIRVPSDSVSDFVWTNGIFGHLLREPGLASGLWARDAETRAPGGALSTAAFLDDLAEMRGQIEPHALRDWARWSADYAAWWGWRGDVVGPTEELNGIVDWLGGRDPALDAARP